MCDFICCFFKVKKVFLFFILALMVSGCATYSDGIKKSLEAMAEGNYEQAEKDLKSSLKPSGRDSLLYYMELGTIRRLEKNFFGSNNCFETAERISEELYTKKSKDLLASLLINPRRASYSGKDFEKVFINYYKSLNYFDLYRGGEGSSELEDSIVELKRLDYKLKSFEIEKGSYSELLDYEKQTFAKLLNIFRKFQGKSLNSNWLKYREDAYFRYFSGMMYEFAGEYDSARIDYEKAASLYENGYVKQYDLDLEMAERSWFDTIRMMIKSGGYESRWPNLAKEKLSHEMLKKVRSLNKKECEIIIIDHLGKIPQRKELNLHLKAKNDISSFSIRPVPTGTNTDINDQLAWFSLYYSDKNPVDLMRSYSSDNLYEFLDGVGARTIFLGPLWEKVEQIGLAEAIGEDGVRITIPYYPPIRSPYGESELIVGKERKKLIRGESLGSLALQSQLINTGKDLNEELARASLKVLLAHEAVSKVAGGSGNDFLDIAGKLVASASSVAETRNWLSLPLEIRINRIVVSPGEHEVKIITRNKNGSILSTETRMIKVKPGESKIWIKRTF